MDSNDQLRLDWIEGLLMHEVNRKIERVIRSIEHFQTDGRGLQLGVHNSPDYEARLLARRGLALLAIRALRRETRNA